MPYGAIDNSKWIMANKLLKNFGLVNNNDKAI